MNIYKIDFENITENFGVKKNFRIPNYINKIKGICLFINNSFDSVSPDNLVTRRRMSFIVGNVSLLLNGKHDKILLDYSLRHSNLISIKANPFISVMSYAFQYENLLLSILPLNKEIIANSNHEFVFKESDIFRKMKDYSPVDGNDYSTWQPNLSLYLIY